MLGLVGIVGAGGRVKKRKTRSSHESILTCKLALSILSELIDFTSEYFHTFSYPVSIIAGICISRRWVQILARVKFDLVLLVLYLILQLYSTSDLA